MPTISFSPNWLFSGTDTQASQPTKAIAKIICGGNYGGSGFSPSQPIGLFDMNYALTSPNPTSLIYIMKGTMPSDFTTLTSLTSLSANILITFNSASITRQVNTNPARILTSGVNASASGLATWFRAISYSTNGNLLYNQFIGSIGPIGSGADLEISDTNIVSGRGYSIFKLLLALPESFDY